MSPLVEIEYHTQLAAKALMMPQTVMGVPIADQMDKRSRK